MNLRSFLVGMILICAVGAGGSLGAGPAQAQDLASVERKAKAGDAKAQYDLAGDYYNGKDVAKDPKQGLLWLRKSADQGYVWAEKALGVMYRDGDQITGVPKNPREAALWFRKAARQENKPAQASLSQMLAEGLISRQEANWHSPQPTAEAKTGNPKAFSLAEVEKGLQGGITCKRLAALVDQFKVDFTLTAEVRQRLDKDGADDKLLTTISASKRSL